MTIGSEEASKKTSRSQLVVLNRAFKLVSVPFLDYLRWKSDVCDWLYV